MIRRTSLAALTALGIFAASANAQATAPAQKPAKPATTVPAQTAAAPAQPAAKPAGTMAATSAKTTQLDINTATKDQLVALAGIGETYADAIIKGRPYKSKSELRTRKVLPESVYKKVKADLTAHSAKP